ncbi:pirin family protein [Paenibacillus lycopersici]|uniref:Pirin family protein n=1 Tax=Paenibacillus lycopersici TaxID=2704462 RepID=A0A6C0FNW4_9BACL|nr:pirin-like C-terminal cupin domain-containing protein [Paenibacillus lycopersici]QHT58577.1 pirin family protein [Paenibacillus lycopersici]
MTHPSVSERSIESVRTPAFRRNSDIHTVAVVLEPDNWEQYDPFLLMAHDRMRSGVFGLHPHRGMETVTFLIDGRLNHYDSKHGEGVLQPGDAQWMTAGRGVEHVEDAAKDEEVDLLQLWVNLPAAHKMSPPKYQDLRMHDMPVVKEDGAEVRVFSGSYGDAIAGTVNITPVTMLEINLEAGAAVTPRLPGSYNGFLYVLEGEGTFGADAAAGAKGQVLWLGSADPAGPSQVKIQAASKMRVMLYAGEPVREPVVARGPFVMNTEAEIVQAYRDYRNGLF